MKRHFRNYIVHTLIASRARIYRDTSTFAHPLIDTLLHHTPWLSCSHGEVNRRRRGRRSNRTRGAEGEEEGGHLCKNASFYEWTNQGGKERHRVLWHGDVLPLYRYNARNIISPILYSSPPPLEKTDIILLFETVQLWWIFDQRSIISWFNNNLARDSSVRVGRKWIEMNFNNVSIITWDLCKRI